MGQYNSEYYNLIIRYNVGINKFYIDFERQFIGSLLNMIPNYLHISVLEYKSYIENEFNAEINEYALNAYYNNIKDATKALEWIKSILMANLLVT